LRLGSHGAPIDDIHDKMPLEPGELVLRSVGGVIQFGLRVFLLVQKKPANVGFCNSKLT